MLISVYNSQIEKNHGQIKLIHTTYLSTKNAVCVNTPVIFIEASN